MKTTYTAALILFLFITFSSLAEDNSDGIPFRSIHEAQSLEHVGDGTSSDVPTVTNGSLNGTGKRKIVFGYHPYWADKDAYLYYDYNVLTHLAYFSYEIDTATGSYKTVNGWNKTPMIAYAHERGVKVVLGVTNFGNSRNTAFLSDTNKQNRFIDSVIVLLTRYDGDGVNMDLESVPGSQRTNLVGFMKKLYTRVKAVLPEAEISVASPAVDWSKAWDYKALSQWLDYFMIMCYDYYWSGSTTAGPVSPLTGGSYNVTNTINSYLKAGVEPVKLLMGVPWYGMVWPVEDNSKNSGTTDDGTSYTYNKMKQLGASYSARFDTTYKCPWFKYSKDGKYYEGWYDDSLSLALKYKLVNDKGLGGIGVWAINYAKGSSEIWNGVAQAFIPEGPGLVTDEFPDAIDIRFDEFGNAVIIANSGSAAAEIKIADIFGNIVFSGTTESNNYFIPAAGLSSGMYLAIVRSSGRVITKKFILRK